MVFSKSIIHIKSISGKLILAFISFITLPLLINGTLMFYKTKSVLESRINNYTQSTLTFISSDIDKLITDYDWKFIDLYSRKKIFSELDKYQANSNDKLKSEVIINDDLNKYLSNNSFMESVYLFSNNGEIYYASKSGVKDSNFINLFNNNKSLKKRILELNGEGITFPLCDGELTYFCIARVFKNIYGNFKSIGIGVIIIDRNNISEICSDIHIPKNVSLYILSSDNSIIFKKGDIEAINKYIEREGNNILSTFENGIRTINIDNTGYVLVKNTAEHTKWKYLEFIRERELISEVFEIQSYFLFITGISLLFFIVITILVSQQITNPIKRLAQAMDKFKRGNLEMEISINSSDEVGALYESFNHMRIRIKNLIEDIRKVSEKEKDAEIRALKSQLNPHFLYNALGAVNWLAVENNQFQISDMLTQLSDLLRYSLDKDSSDTVTLRDDIRWLKTYINFQKKRFNKKIDVIFNVDPFVLDFRIPKLLIQPLVENSIIHGLACVDRNGLIIINIQGHNNEIYFEIIDNGAGIESDKLTEIVSEDNAGMGIKNVQERLKLYYGESYGLEVKSEIGQGVRISFRIPRNNYL